MRLAVLHWTPMSSDLRRCDVLVVDDDEATGESLLDALTQEGLTTEWAASGAAALALLEGGLTPAMLLVDANMPEMHGTAVAAALRSDPERQHLPLVLMTGDDRFLNEPVHATLKKPFGIDQLLRVVWPLVRGEPWNGSD